MKKTLFILTVIFSICLLNADVVSYEELQKGFLNQLQTEKVHFDSLLYSKVEFSQEEYGIGEIIDITIHFEINTERNTGNLRFAITDPVNKTFHLHLHRRFLENVTQEEIERRFDEEKSDPDIPLISRDPDLMLSNAHPKGEYHIQYQLNRKRPAIKDNYSGTKYPFLLKDILMFSFSDSFQHNYIVEYKGIKEHLKIPVKLKPSAIDENPYRYKIKRQDTPSRDF